MSNVKARKDNHKTQRGRQKSRQVGRQADRESSKLIDLHHNTIRLKRKKKILFLTKEAGGCTNTQR